MRRSTAIFLFILPMACGSSESGGGNAGPGGGGGGDDGGIKGGGIQGAGCDPSKDLGCDVNEETGVFVSFSKGTDDGDGSRARPVKTLTAGIKMARAAKKKVYACAETFAEAVELAPGVSMYGFFECLDWKMNLELRARIDGAGKREAVRAMDIGNQGVRVMNFEIVASDWKGEQGASSVAVFALRSPGVEFASCVIRARDGGDGRDALVPPVATEESQQIAAPGTDQTRCDNSNALCITQIKGGAGGTSVCKINGTPFPELNGGAGGTGGKGYAYQYTLNVQSQTFEWIKKADFQPGGAQPASSTTAAGGATVAATGQPGADGAAGDQGKGGADFGTIDESGYVGANGTPGASGKPGQGGGGGAGADRDLSPTNAASFEWIYGAAGGGGGSGGCAGYGGQGGQAGGASIAVLALDSPLIIRDTRIATGVGGMGGRGSRGAIGLAGRSGLVGGHGSNGVSINGGGGAGGGAGGPGGPGGPGGGGPSVGIAAKGTAPQRVNVKFELGQAGKGRPVEAGNPLNSADGLLAEEKDL